MRMGWLFLGVALGVAGVASRSQERQGQAGREPAETPPGRAQGDEAREALGHMLEDVAHRPGIPETPIKQAFEHAIEG